MKVSFLLVYLIHLKLGYGNNYRIEVIEDPEIYENRQKAVDWLFSMQNKNGGWGTGNFPETHRVLTSIILSNESYRNEDDVRYQKALDHLKKKLSFILSEQINTISAGQLALYTNALKAVCRDARNFNGVNIIKIMINKYRMSTYETGLVILSACITGEKDFPINQELNSDFLRNLSSYFIDSRAMIVMALICIKENYETNEYDKHIKEQIELFKALQTSEGKFGNVYTSALVIQALIAARDNGDDWSLKNGIDYLLSEQKDDGSFGDLLATYFVLPVLSGKSFRDLDDTNCQKSDRKIIGATNVAKQQSENKILGRLKDVTYSIWIEKNISSNCFIFYSKKFTVPENSTFFQLMEIAGNEDDRYKFTVTNYSWGSFIKEINGIHNDNVNNHYWMLNKINEKGNLILTEHGVDKEIPKNDDYYIFKYCISNCDICNEGKHL